MSAGHTECGWEIVEYDGEILAIHALNSDWRVCFMATPGSSPNEMSRIEANARLIVAACNSYDRHFGPRAIEAAEADLLGKALEALRELRPSNLGAIPGWMSDDETLPVDITIGELRRLDAILSQAREVK